MDKKQLFAMFSINLAMVTVGGSLSALMPVYFTRLGASSALIGVFMSAVFAALACGMLVAGRVSDKRAFRKPILIAGGILVAAATYLYGWAANLGQLALLSILSAFLQGLQLTVVNTLAGLYTRPGQRGRVFGVLGSANSIGAILSLPAGVVVLHWGFKGLFNAAPLFLLLVPLIALFVEDNGFGPAQKHEPSEPVRVAFFRRTFWLLFTASVIAFSMSGVSSLARSLGMARLGLNAAAITSAVAVGGLITLPFPLLLGWLSDRLGRKPLIVLCYSGGAAGLFVLALATHLWQFWVASAFQAVMGASGGIGSALVTDLVPSRRVGAGLSLFGATPFIGNIIGFALAGAAMQRLGFAPTLLTGGLLALLTIALVIPIRQQVSQLPGKPGASLENTSVLVLKEGEK